MSLERYLQTEPKDVTSHPEPPLPPDAFLPGATTRAPAKPSDSPGLLLRCWNRNVWALPWSYFMEAHFTADAESDAETSGRADEAAASRTETIHLVFGNRDVFLRGRNLTTLMEPIARHHLWEIREVPEAHLTAADAQSDAPAITEIIIREREK